MAKLISITADGWPSYYLEDHTGMSLAFQAQVTSLVVEGVFEKFPEPKTQKKFTLLIKKKKKINHQEITKTLSNQGFVLVDFVTSPGQYAIRGNIIDVFSFTKNKPIRIECDNDVVERIKVFNIETSMKNELLDLYKIL